MREQAVSAIWFVIAIALFAGAGHSQTPNEAQVGNDACAGCHSAIYKSYSRTPMAHASGPAAENPMAADFTQSTTGTHYRIYNDAGKLWLSFEGAGNAGVRGKRELLYYIGSGRRGRTYLFATDGFFFESPINWYGDRRVWDMTPAYQDAKEMPLNLALTTSCLQCHVSEVQAPKPGTISNYTMPLFHHSGVTCERCHGPGAAHLKGGAIVNPAKLSPARRDDICLQCHLESDTAVDLPGRHAYEYRPGESLTDYVRYFFLNDSRKASLGAVSQVQALARSKCKQESGDKMTCTSCHDPHASPSAGERVAFFRSRCLTCHTGAFAVKHHPEQQDCTSCHMPASSSKDVAHTEVTNHRIPRMAESAALTFEDFSGATLPELIAFPDTKEARQNVRSEALGWYSLASSGMTTAYPRAETTLASALKQMPKDADVLAALGAVKQRAGASDEAQALFQRALAADPFALNAAASLGDIYANQGKLRAAVEQWQKVFARDPARSVTGLNIALAFCASGQYDVSRSLVNRVLVFNPDMSAAKKLKLDLSGPHPGCEVR